jgi:predicted CopG family antitoxin
VRFSKVMIGLNNTVSLYRMFTLTQKNHRIITIHDDTYESLRHRGTIPESFNYVINQILEHHEKAVSIIGDCETCKAKFREAIRKG